MATFDIDGDMIRKLAGLLEETGLTEIEFAEGERRVRVTKAGQPVFTAAVQAPAHAGSAGGQPPVPATSLASHPGALTSPMVGTAYVSPEPSAPAFVKVGDPVRAGQTVLIIEAMKVMNPIKAPKAGVVVDILVKDAQPVEFGEILMIIE
jgi:acetyl-CoA carboxylase biotin carboxyl carrier protein